MIYIQVIKQQIKKDKRHETEQGFDVVKNEHAIPTTEAEHVYTWDSRERDFFSTLEESKPSPLHITSSGDPSSKSSSLSSMANWPKVSSIIHWRSCILSSAACLKPRNEGGKRRNKGKGEYEKKERREGEGKRKRERKKKQSDRQEEKGNKANRLEVVKANRLEVAKANKLKRLQQVRGCEGGCKVRGCEGE